MNELDVLVFWRRGINCVHAMLALPHDEMICRNWVSHSKGGLKLASGVPIRVGRKPDIVALSSTCWSSYIIFQCRSVIGNILNMHTTS